MWVDQYQVGYPTRTYGQDSHPWQCTASTWGTVFSRITSESSPPNHIYGLINGKRYEIEFYSNMNREDVMETSYLLLDDYRKPPLQDSIHRLQTGQNRPYLTHCRHQRTSTLSSPIILQTWDLFTFLAFFHCSCSFYPPLHGYDQHIWLIPFTLVLSSMLPCLHKWAISTLNPVLFSCLILVHSLSHSKPMGIDWLAYKSPHILYNSIFFHLQLVWIKLVSSWLSTLKI